MFTANSPKRRKALRRFGDRARSRCECSYRETYTKQTYGERDLIDYRAGILRSPEYCTVVLYWYRYSTSTGKKTPGGTVPVLYCTGALTGLRREPPPITGTGSCQYNCIGRYLKRSARKFQCPFHTHYETTSSRQTLRRRHLATRAVWSHSRCRRRTSFWESVSRPQGKTASEIPPVCPLALS